MVTIIGNTRYYDNIRLAWASHPGNEDEVYMAFTDPDSDIVHLMPIAKNKIDQYVELGRQTVLGVKVETFGEQDMPKPGGVT